MTAPAQQIIARTAQAFGVAVAELTGPSRLGYIVRARQAACWALRRAPLRYGPQGEAHRRSFPRIGALLGGKDHSSIIYHTRQAEARRASDPEWRALLDALLCGAPVPLIACIRPAAPPPRQIRARSDFALTDACPRELADTDAAKRQAASLALGAALAAYHAGRASA